MHKVILNFILFIIIAVSFGFGQSNWQWVQSVGSAGDDQALSIVADAQHNTYITGFFSANINFGQGIILQSAGSEDMFLAKYNASGSIVWAIKAGGFGSDKGLDIKIDKLGNILVLGHFSSMAHFGSTSIESSNGANSFIAKYSTNGELLWVKKLGGYAKSFALDTNNHIFVSANYAGNIKVDTVNIVGNAKQNIYSAKFTPLGDICWLKKIINHSGNNYPIAIANSTDNQILLTVRFNGTCLFDDTNDSLIQTGGSNSDDMILVKYNQNGDIQWKRHFKTSLPNLTNTKTIVCDNQGDIYLTGTFSNRIDIGTKYLYSNGSTDIFVARLNSDATTTKWLKQFGTTTAETAIGIDISSQNDHLYFVGHYSDSMFINNISIPKPGIIGSWLFKLDTLGAIEWIKTASGNINTMIHGIHQMTDGTTMICGKHSGTSFFNSNSITSNGGFDLFFAKSTNQFILPLRANFEALPTQTYPGGQVQMHDYSTGNPVSWSWSFEGGIPATSNEQNPQVTYPHSGNYTVKLVVQNQNNEVSELEQLNYIQVFIHPCNTLEFDGTDDYINCNSPSLLRFQKNFTIETWVNPFENRGFIMSYLHGTTNYKSGYALGYVNGKWRFLLQTASMSVSEWENLPGVDLPFFQWTHVAATFNGSMVKIYKNGLPYDSLQITSSTENLIWYQIPTGFFIGKGESLENQTEFFKGYINELRIWKTTLTDAEIQARFQVKVSANEPFLQAYWNFNEGEGTVLHDLTISNFHGSIENNPLWIPSSIACWGVGVSKIEPVNIQFFPNPFTNEIHFKNLSPNSEISIYNSSGELVKKHKSQSSDIKMDVSNLAVGIYIIQIKTSVDVIHFKTIKHNN